MTVRASWRGKTIAESDETVVIEGNHYFPPASVRWEHLEASWVRSVCPWKGIARYYAVRADGGHTRNAAWSYPRPFPWVRRIRGYVAFGNGVVVRHEEPARTTATRW